jgi:hypothetical protein
MGAGHLKQRQCHALQATREHALSGPERRF